MAGLNTVIMSDSLYIFSSFVIELLIIANTFSKA